jgi:hypothetical protein
MRVFGEGVVIVVSILLGLGIDAWWDNRQAAALETDVLRALALEVAANQEILRSNTDELNSILDLNARFIESEPEILAQLPADSVFSWVAALVSYRTFDPLSGAAILLSQTSLPSRDAVAIRAQVTEWLTVVADAREECDESRQRAGDVIELLASYSPEHGAEVVPSVAMRGPSVLSEIRRDRALVARLRIKASVQRLCAGALTNGVRAGIDTLAAALSQSSWPAPSNPSLDLTLR